VKGAGGSEDRRR